MQVVPLQAIPSQTIQVQLAGQACVLSVYQLSTGLFMDVYVGGQPIVVGVICQDRNRIVRDLYLGFVGDFAFIDTLGSSDPNYAGLNSQYYLNYLDSFDLPAGEG